MPKTRVNGIEYHIRNEGGSPSIREHWARGTNQATAVCQVAWEQYDAWLVDMLGFSRFSASAPSLTGLTRQLPEAHPTRPWMIASDIELMDVLGEVNEKGRSGWTDFEGGALAVCQVTFRDVLYRRMEDQVIGEFPASVRSELYRFVERQERYNIESLSLKGTQFVARGNTFPGEAAMLYPNSQLVYRWYYPGFQVSRTWSWLQQAVRIQ